MTVHGGAVGNFGGNPDQAVYAILMEGKFPVPRFIERPRPGTPIPSVRFLTLIVDAREFTVPTAGGSDKEPNLETLGEPIRLLP